MNQSNLDNITLGIDSPQDDSSYLPRARGDVEITEQVYYGKPCYVLKDPTTLRYYRLRPPEYTIYQMLDGKATMEDVLKVLSERFPKDEFDAQAVMGFIIMLRGGNLLHVPGDSNIDYLLKRKKMLTRGIFQRLRQEFLFFRIPLFDPDRLLNYLQERLGGIIFSRFSAIVVWGMLVGALALFFSNIDNLSQRQPLLSWINLLYLVPSLFFIKIIHEFGHGLTSKHFDTEVHEMGILFLVFMPCMYCDVSDAWMVAEKRKRMWITAAGIVVEIILAGLATYIWALTVPGSIINQFALNVMLAASVNTILFNGNPLLRYDGYFFLMDMMEIPNLKQKGTSYLWYLMQRFILGLDSATEPIDIKGREPAVLGYAICSAIYRWFIMVAIITMVWKFLDPYGWGLIGGIMALGCIYTSFITPIVKFVKFMFTQRTRLHIRLAGASILAVVFGGAVYGLLLLPVEQSVDAQCILRPARIHPLYVSQAGFIDTGINDNLLRDSQDVTVGQTLLVLSNPQLEYEVNDLQLQIEQMKIEAYQAHQQGHNARKAQIDAEIKGLRVQYDRIKRNRDKLTIKSPIDGLVQMRTGESMANLDGKYLPLQAELLAVYAPGQFEAVAAISHRDIELIKPGQKVLIKLWARDDQVIESQVQTKPPAPVLKMSSPAFSTAFHGEVPTLASTEKEQALEPAENTYELVLPLAEVDLQLRDGMVGRAKIIIEKQTVAQTVYRWLITTLRLDLRL